MRELTASTRFPSSSSADKAGLKGPMRYHYKNRSKWIGSPSGFVYFGGLYHIFFGTNPLYPRFGPLHIGHIVTEDFLDWEERDIAVSPSDGDLVGIKPGCAFEADGRLWLFYTAESEGSEFINCAVSDDGNIFEDKKMEVNLLSPFEDKRYMRNPYVFEYEGKYKLIACASDNGIGRVVIYDSDDLTDWEYKGITADIPAASWSCGEMPELFEEDGVWVMAIQTARAMPHKCLYATGDFDGYKFTPDSGFFALETGSAIESPRSCLTPDGRRIQTAWMYDHRNNTACFTAPRRLMFDYKGHLVMLPAEEVEFIAKKMSPFVEYEAGRLNIRFENKTLMSVPYASEPEIRVLEDVGTLEIFINGGREVLSLYIC